MALQTYAVTITFTLEVIAHSEAEAKALWLHPRALDKDDEEMPTDELQAAIDAGEAEGEVVGEHTEDISYKFR